VVKFCLSVPIASCFVQQSSEESTHLERLAAELARRGLDAQVITKSGRLLLKVTNPDTPDLNERVLCHRAEDQSPCFWWPWQQPIGSVDDLETVAGKIAAVLRSVEGGHDRQER
jgi:hypothetical protein